MTKLQFLQTLPTRQTLYVLISRLTRLPYVECNQETFDDEAFLITEEATALERAKRLSDEGRSAVAMKVEQKDMLRLFNDFYAYGVNSLVVDAEGTIFRIKPEEAVRRPSLDKLPADKRPMENPQLQMSMMYYLQEARRENADPEKISELEEEMAVNLIRAKYLLPVKEVEIDGKKQTQMMMIRMKDGESAAPIFSDTVEFSRFRRDQELRAAVITFEKLAELPLPEEVKGFMLNPTGVGLTLTRDYIKKELQLNR